MPPPDARPPEPEEAIVAVFRREAEEQVGQAETALLELERAPDDRGALKRLFRALHSLKGNAAVVGLDDLEAAVHRLETVLHPVREGERLVDRPTLDALFPLLYALRDAALLDAGLPPGDRIERLARLVEQAPVPEKAPANVFRLIVEYPGEMRPAAFDPGFVLQDVADLGDLVSVRLDPDSVLPLERLEQPEALFLRYVIELRTARTIDEVREGCVLFEEAVQVSIEPVQEVRAAGPARGRAAAAHGNALRVEATRLDRLMNLASEIATTAANLRRLAERGDGRDTVLEVVDRLETHSQALQDEILGARMISIDELLRPFVRLVRELSAVLDKRVELAIDGGGVELDKALVEHLREPLTHLVRNALDHGIEPPGERVAAGKRAEGRIAITASQREGSIYLTVADDGRGLDRARIRAKAVARGLLPPEAAVADAEVDALIFESGLSTAEKVTNVSGRGIGMDVVRKSIEHVHGEIRVASEPGLGAAFHVRLPLTLAVIGGFLAGIGEETIVIPMHAVTECLDLPPEAHRHEAFGFFNLRGAPLPYLRLRERFRLAGEPPARERVVVVRHESARVGLVVDALYGESQTVIKPLGTLFGGLRSVSGATILWNGRVALILDVPGLIREIAGEIQGTVSMQVAGGVAAGGHSMQEGSGA